MTLLEETGRNREHKLRPTATTPVFYSTDIHFGFDDVFTGWEDRAAPWNKPLRLRYKSKEVNKTIYFFVNFHQKYGMRTSDNQVVYENLKAILER